MTDVSNVVAPVRRRTLGFYFTLLFIVAPFWCVVPGSWGVVLYSFYSWETWGNNKCLKTILFVAACEALFSLYHFHLSRRVSSFLPPAPTNLAELQAAYTRVLKAGLVQLPEDGPEPDGTSLHYEDISQLSPDDPRAIDFRNVLRQWFNGAPWSHIAASRQHVMSWLYWSTFNASLPSSHEIPHAQRVALDDALDLLQKRSGSSIVDDPDLKYTVSPMLLTIDPTNVHFRPLSLYLLIFCVNYVLKRVYERRYGAKFRDYDGLNYLIRIPKGWTQRAGPRPIVFLHGLGFGLFQYHHLIHHFLKRYPDRPILIPLQPWVSQDLFHPRFLNPMDRHEAGDKLAALISVSLGWAPREVKKDGIAVSSDETEDIASDEKARHHRRGVTMLSHSNGSYLHAWMLKSHGKMVARSCFVDPVTFCSWEGHVCYNFFYQPACTSIELLMRYFIASELGVANFLQRRFDWSSNALWYEEIPNARDPSKTMFVLGAKDNILNAERVKLYLTSHGANKGLWYDPNGGHGDALMHGGPGHTVVTKWLEDEEE